MKIKGALEKKEEKATKKESKVVLEKYLIFISSRLIMEISLFARVFDRASEYPDSGHWLDSYGDCTYDDEG